MSGLETTDTAPVQYEDAQHIYLRLRATTSQSLHFTNNNHSPPQKPHTHPIPHTTYLHTLPQWRPLEAQALLDLLNLSRARARARAWEPLQRRIHRPRMHG